MKKIIIILIGLLSIGCLCSGCAKKEENIPEYEGGISIDTNDSETVKQIKEDYLKATGANNDHTTQDVFMSLQGPFTHDDKTSYICFITASYMMYTQALWSETIDGLTFSYRNGNRYQVYYDHKFYTLQEGFDQGLINHEDLLTIYNPQNAHYQESIVSAKNK